MSKHTDGPWVVSRDDTSSNGALIGVYVSHVGSGMIAQAFWNCLVNTDEQCRANARLIAAAPDLLAALEFCTEQIQNEGLQGWGVGAPAPDFGAALQLAEDAIAKARGDA